MAWVEVVSGCVGCFDSPMKGKGCWFIMGGIVYGGHWSAGEWLKRAGGSVEYLTLEVSRRGVFTGELEHNHLVFKILNSR